MKGKIKMNKQHELKDLEMKYKELGKEIEKLKNTKEKWPQTGDTYYFFDILGHMVSRTYEDEEYCEFRIATGNFHRTEDEAKSYHERLVVTQMLRNVAEDLNGEEKIDWRDEVQYKFRLYLDEDNKINYGWSIDIKYLTIYCLKGQEFKELAIERIGEERLVEFFLNY